MAATVPSDPGTRGNSLTLAQSEFPGPHCGVLVCGCTTRRGQRRKPKAEGAPELLHVLSALHVEAMGHVCRSSGACVL